MNSTVQTIAVVIAQTTGRFTDVVLATRPATTPETIAIASTCQIGTTSIHFSSRFGFIHIY
ncbi:MAG: hypothetical protein QF357_00045 [Dehalococcoidia bacterium]|nr:hypothetical protein [Dehalococcoidia bacterium]